VQQNGHDGQLPIGLHKKGASTNFMKKNYDYLCLYKNTMLKMHIFNLKAKVLYYNRNSSPIPVPNSNPKPSG